MVTLYQNNDFSGTSIEFDVGSHNWIGRNHNDCVSSLKVKVGYKVTLFEHGHFSGRKGEFGPGDHNTDALTRHGFPNDCVSSLIVEKFEKNEMECGMYL